MAGRNDNRINAKLEFYERKVKTRKGKSRKKNIRIVAALLHINYVYRCLKSTEKCAIFFSLLYKHRKAQHFP